MAGPTPDAQRPRSRTDSRPLRLEPFRGLRFDPSTVGDLATVISPPYDVLDADTVRSLEGANRHNIVRLILSRRFERPYLAVRDRLEAWRECGYLRADPSPTLYVYEYTAEGATVRGLIGLVALRDDSEGVVLPHEDVMPAPVADRAVLMRTTRTNLEPILLVHQASRALRALVARVASSEPESDVVALDGSSHRLWACTDPTFHATVRDELAGGEALIADGHHRWAAYQRLQQELRGNVASDSSPWDFGLAMLVVQDDRGADDSSTTTTGLRVGPIHRSVASMTLADVRDLCETGTARLQTYADREAALTAWRSGSSDTAVAFALCDGHQWGVLTVKRTDPVDAAVLHESLLPAWGVAEEQIGYHHSLEQALDATRRQPGLVVAVHPPQLEEVMSSAAGGVRMPRKSTSFYPKPRMGIVMRDLRDA